MFLTAFLIGLTGSLHCVGMCSPLAVAVTSLKAPFLPNRLLYNFGRIISYGLLGATVSVFGAVAGLGEFQHLLAFLLGFVLIALGAAGIHHVRIPLLSQFLQRITSRLKTAFSRYVQSRSAWSMLVLGGINGLLPCGLTFIALGYCMGLTGASQGFVFMLAFGAGTLPAMIGVTTIVQIFTARNNFRFHYIASTTMILLGALLIFRAGYEHRQEPDTQGTGMEVICR